MSSELLRSHGASSCNETCEAVHDEKRVVERIMILQDVDLGINGHAVSCVDIRISGSLCGRMEIVFPICRK